MALLLQLTQKLAHGFQAFWERWPRKVGKLEAEQAWKKHVTPADEEPIQKALDWQVPMFQQRETEYIPHAKTWLRNRRWEDEPPTTTPNRVIAKAAPMTARQVSEANQYRDQQQKTREVLRLMADEGLSRDDAMSRVFR